MALGPEPVEGRVLHSKRRSSRPNRMEPVVYVDIWCLKRPFDDQRQERVRLEAAAVAALIARAEGTHLNLVHSPAHDLENDRNPREDRRLATALWLAAAQVSVGMDDEVTGRARHLAMLGFGTIDALHLAFAERAGARWFATTEDRLVARADERRQELKVSVCNPRTLLDLLAEGHA